VKIKKRLIRQPRYVFSKTLQTINSAGPGGLFKNETFISGAIGNVNPFKGTWSDPKKQIKIFSVFPAESVKG